jgi:hypothetical protein
MPADARDVPLAQERRFRTLFTIIVIATLNICNRCQC